MGVEPTRTAFSGRRLCQFAYPALFFTNPRPRYRTGPSGLMRPGRAPARLEKEGHTSFCLHEKRCPTPFCNSIAEGRVELPRHEDTGF